MSLHLESLPPMCPLHFFSLSLDLAYGKKIPSKIGEGKFTLPDTTELLGEDEFAEFKMAWNEDGLIVDVQINKPFEDVSYPDFRKGDSLELCIDTRDLKTAGFFHKFCHHFLILPQAVGEIQVQEISKFRTEDSHPLCDPSELSVETKFMAKEFRMQIKISKEALYGFEPQTCKKIGFTYRLNRPGKDPQHFALSSLMYSIEQHPALWASLNLGPVRK